MKRLERLFIMLAVFSAVPLWSQSEGVPVQPSQTTDQQTTQQPAQPSQPVPAVVGASDSGSDQMLLPPAVGGQNYPTEVTGQERSNFLRGGVSFTSGYTDNVGSSENGKPLSDITYSVAPMIALDKTTSRTHLSLMYAPGYTFYQRTSTRNEADQNGSIAFTYRFSPHVSLTAQDNVQKSSNIFSQADFNSGSVVSGGAQSANFSPLAPFADHLTNSGNVALNYQFARNASIGVSGTFTNLHYPDQSQVSGLGDSNSQGGSFFYVHRLSRKHYISVTYQYQRLVGYQQGVAQETQTHGVMFFYTLYVNPHFSISGFGGPQYSDTAQPPVPPLNLQLPDSTAWSPSAGGSLSWQGKLTNIAFSYAHAISGGGGLSGASHVDSASLALRQRLNKTLEASASGSYTNNNTLAGILNTNNNGHTISANASLRQALGQHFDIQLGYSRLHQTYANVSVLSQAPDTNREFVSLSYVFSRPLGR